MERRPRAMSEEPFSPLQAASALREVARWSDPLLARTVGLTWLVWSLVAPAIFVTYAWAAAAQVGALALALAWLPWATMGLLVTFLLARSARVERAPSVLSSRELLVHAALFLAATVGAATVVLVLRLPLAAPAAVLLGLGLLVGMLGARDAAAGERAPGILQLAGGVVLLAFALSEASAGLGDESAALANAVATAVVLAGVGAFRYAWRG